ncbi:hypothetical protein [Streptomyces sp. NPDC056061]|uniref:hypothetical protein n=1 Tax=Streptomyces sp. NPDC056061 TaxID=3345700 RepID=UPI0035DF80F7
MARKRKTGGRVPRRTRWLGTLIALVVCGAAAGGVAAYRSLADDTEERPVTMEEASRLALSRLNLYQASPVAVTLTATEGGGVVVRVKGVVDYRTHRAVGSYQVTGSSGSSGPFGPSGASGPVAGQLDRGLVVWDTGGLGLAPVPKGGSSPSWQQAERIPRSGWSSRSYTADPLDAGLQLLIGLGADRPENPLLLAQSGARRLERDRIDGRDYDRFAGPRAQGATPGAGPDGGRSPLTYWVDDDGGLRRVTMRMPGLGNPTTIEFSGRDGRAEIPATPWGSG